MPSKRGVKVGVGTDFSGYPAHLNAREFKMLIEAGTQVNAELLQLENDIGTLAVGKYADIIAVNGNPLEDIGVVEFFPRNGTKTARSLAPSTFPERGAFSLQAYNPRFCSLIHQDQAVSRLIQSCRFLSG